MKGLLTGAALLLPLAGCTGLVGTTPSAPTRPVAADAAYCTEARGLDALLNDSIDHYATVSTLAGQGDALASRFDANAARWRASGDGRWKLLASASSDLRAWISALKANDRERANATALALWRDYRALPACSG